MRNDKRAFLRLNFRRRISMGQVGEILLMTIGMASVISCDAIFNKPKTFAVVHELYTESSIDSSINQYVLMDSTSFVDIPSRLLQANRIDDYNNGEGVYLVNSRKKEYLFVRFNPGGMERQFDIFILTDSVPDIDASSLLLCNDSSFITNNGAFIGMSVNDFKAKYSYARMEDNDMSEYSQYDSIRMIYNKYLFKGNVLKRIEIGYDW